MRPAGAWPEPNATLLRGDTRIARVRLCRSLWEQLRGLIGCAPLPPGEGIALPRCAAVHTALVRAPIDVLFLRQGRVIGIADGVRPWSVARCRGAMMAVELAAGSALRLAISVGDLLVVEED